METQSHLISLNLKSHTDSLLDDSGIPRNDVTSAVKGSESALLFARPTDLEIALKFMFLLEKCNQIVPGP